jgi:SH3 domain-containing protein
MKSRETRRESGERTIKSKFIVVLLLIAAGAAYYLYIRRRAQHAEGEAAYVLARALNVVDTTAEIRLTVGTLKAGDRVEVLEHTPRWMHVRLANGRTGWVENKDMLDSETYERGQRLLKELGRQTQQAVGHVSELVNLHLEPARDATVLAQLDANQKVEIFGRRLIERPPQPDQPPTGGAVVRDAWYLVRADSRAGWLLGRTVDLDAPPGIAPYAQDVNMVAWLVLDMVEDQGRNVPQYLVADRLGEQDLDFNHIRVFTWWKKRQQYVTAYVEGGLDGYFPLRAIRLNNVPYFRLRLIDENAHKIQKVYGMFDTIVRPIGTVEGWESDAMPERPPSRLRHARKARGRHRRR